MSKVYQVVSKSVVDDSGDAVIWIKVPDKCRVTEGNAEPVRISLLDEKFAEWPLVNVEVIQYNNKERQKEKT
jgi:hypothetical protein